MYTLNLSDNEFLNLKPFKLMEGTLEKESNMYFMPNNENEIIKIYKNYNDKDYINFKMKTIDNFMKFMSEYNFKELLKPNGILKVNNEIRGVIYPKINGLTTRVYLNSNYTDVKTKITILKKIGLLLDKIKKTSPKYNAAFSDVHVDNFIVNDYSINDLNDISITACDTDSMRVLDSNGVPGFYLYDAEKLEDFSKYEIDNNYNIIPNSNTDIYCYIMLILDVISKSEYVFSLNIDEYNRYINYLKDNGLNDNLVDSFLSIYEDKDNISPLPYLDYLNDINNDMDLVSFYKKRFK